MTAPLDPWPYSLPPNTYIILYYDHLYLVPSKKLFSQFGYCINIFIIYVAVQRYKQQYPTARTGRLHKRREKRKKTLGPAFLFEIIANSVSCLHWNMEICNAPHKKVVLTLLIFLQATIVIMYSGISVHSFYKHQGPDYKSHSELSENLKLYMKVRNNPVYRHLDILDRGRRESVNLLVIVSSAPKRSDRRIGIRETWWPLCKSNGKVLQLLECLIFLGIHRYNNYSIYILKTLAKIPIIFYFPTMHSEIFGND